MRTGNSERDKAESDRAHGRRRALFVRTALIVPAVVLAGCQKSEEDMLERNREVRAQLVAAGELQAKPAEAENAEKPRQPHSKQDYAAFYGAGTGEDAEAGEPDAAKSKDNAAQESKADEGAFDDPNSDFFDNTYAGVEAAQEDSASDL